MFLAIAVIVFVTSCAGLGYLAGLLVRRRKWPGWMSGFMSVAIALLWPAFVIGEAIYGAGHYQRQSPSDPGDAPAYVLMGVFLFLAPLLFVIGLPLALIGSYIARRRHFDEERSDDGAA